MQICNQNVSEVLSILLQPLATTNGQVEVSIWGETMMANVIVVFMMMVVVVFNPVVRVPNFRLQVQFVLMLFLEDATIKVNNPNVLVLVFNKNS